MLIQWEYMNCEEPSCLNGLGKQGWECYATSQKWGETPKGNFPLWPIYHLKRKKE